MNAWDLDVLVVGAGPSGLAVALQAGSHGARVRVVERRVQPFRPSRALIVHPRTMEVLRPLGVTDSLLARGDPSPSVRLHLGRREAVVTLGDFSIPDTAFPYLLFAAQAAVEDVLRAALADRGVEVEYGTELVAVHAGPAGAEARLRRGARHEDVNCRYVAGCDGATSTVRRAAGIAWPGAAYREEAVLADVELDGDLAVGQAHAVAGRAGVLFVFALGERATWRLLATRPAAPAAGGDTPGERVPRGQLQRLLDDSGLGARVTGVAWSARVPLQHRLAAAYRSGPLFLVGDAAHVHSPAGGQGMNTGIGDATNLGWKLGFAASAPPGPATDRLLASYEGERRPVARRVLALTNAIFWAEAHTGPLATAVRTVVAAVGAPVVPFALRRRRLAAAGVRVLSQLGGHYPPSGINLDAGPPGQRLPHAGYRLPDARVDIGGHRRELHEVVAAPGIHVLLQAGATGLDAGDDPRIHLWRVSSWPGAGTIAVRPDGYVGYRDPGSDPARLTGWLAAVTGGRR